MTPGSITQSAIHHFRRKEMRTKTEAVLFHYVLQGPRHRIELHHQEEIINIDHNGTRNEPVLYH
jgi:hypothetical protein